MGRGPTLWRTLLGLALLAPLAGCGFFVGEPEPLRPLLGGEGPTRPAPNVHAQIPPPQVPPELTRKAETAARAVVDKQRQYAVTIDCRSPEEELCELFGRASRLAVMNREGDGRAPLATLEQRLRVSLEEDGRDILHSHGFYDGRVTGNLAPAEENVLAAIVTFAPGPRYLVGRTEVALSGPLEDPPSTDVKPPPSDLAEAGLPAGSEARAAAVLAAVDLAARQFRNRGYPRAQVTATRYTLLPPPKQLEAEAWVRPRAFARMGDIRYQGQPIVADRYLTAYRTWEIGQPWNQDLVDQYLASLRQSGLFQTVEGGPGRQRQAGGLRPVWLRLTEAPPRTIGGMVSFDTDFGPGLTGYWEHRNLTRNGDRLRLDMPLWADMQQFTASYRYPFFLDPKQDFIARGGVLHQDTDAYKLWSAALSAGVERRVSRRWKVSLMGALEGGALTDPGQPKKEFFMMGLPISATYDNANDIMNPTRGQRLILQAAPYSGTYKKDFTVVRTRAEGQVFLPVYRDRFILAARAVWGALWEAETAQEIPSSLRFYSGGGGSIRGYDYQSVGPRNEKRDPLGGLTQFETNLETRFRINDTFGFVAFLDGGMVYDDLESDVFSDLAWGTGAGLRVFTPIGPVRADLAFPLDRRKGDSAWQAYISIGQSF